MKARNTTQIRIPLPQQGEVPFFLMLYSLACTAAEHVCGKKALGPFQELKFHSFSLIQRSVAIFLDSGKVDKDVFPGRALNKAIPFGSVEPLDCSLFFHKCNSFRLSSEIGNLLQESAWWRKGCCFAGQSSFPQQMAAVPEGPHCRRLQQPDGSAKFN